MIELLNSEPISQYRNYLNANGVRLRTVVAYENIVRRFLRFLDSENIMPESATYQDLLLYVKNCKIKGNTAHTINMNLVAVGRFYSHLLETGRVKENPAAELRIRGTVHRKPHDLLDWEELEALYQKYPTANLTGKRDKAILGILIYQGLGVGELEQLTLNDIDLVTGKLAVPALARSNSRVLNLDPVQILQLQSYTNQVRPLLLGGRKTSNLFLSRGSSLKLSNVMTQIIRQLVRLRGSEISPKQVRSSVIIHWLSKHNIREVQYMAGHRYLSSTEHYRTDILESLQDQIDTLHPLG